MFRKGSQVYPSEETFNEEEQEDDVSSDESYTETEPSEDEDEDSDSYTDNEEFEDEWIFECIKKGKNEDIDEYLEGSENTNQVLHIAAKGQNVELFEHLLCKNKDKVNKKNSKGKTPLHIAAKYNRSEIAEKLIGNKADIMIRDSKRFTPLLTAVRYNNLEVYNLLKEKMPAESPRENTQEHETALNPLQIAVKFNSDKVAKQLIDKEPTWINTKDEKGKNLVYLATRNNKSRVLKLLLEEVKKISANFTEHFANGELQVTKSTHVSGDQDSDNTNSESKLYIYVKFVQEIDRKEISCPEPVSGGQDSDNTNSESEEIDRKEISCPEQVSGDHDIDNSNSESEVSGDQDSDNTNSESEEIDRKEITCPEPVSGDQDSDNTNSESEEIDRKEISCPEQESERKEIPRRRFQVKSCPKQVFGVHESDNTKSESEEMKSESTGSSNKFEDIKAEGRSDKLEEKSEDKDTPLLIAAQKGNLECLDLLIEYKADLYRTCKGDKTALHLAAENGRKGIVEKLLKAAPKLKYSKDKDDRTALHDAINHAQVVEILIKFRAKVNKKDVNGRTPLSYAAERGKLECTIKLIENGADINLADEIKMEPIHYAAKKGHSEVFKVLATNKNIKLDQSNWNCLELAIDNNHEETALSIFKIENWKDLLRSRSKYDNDYSDEYYDTPMRKLIRKMPNVAKEVFNHCTEIKKDKNKPFHVTFCYEFLNDTYHLDTWKIHKTENPATEQDVIESKERRLKTDMTEAFKKDDETSGLPAKSKETTFGKKGSLAKAHVDFKRTELLDHPLVSALLKTKWMNIGLKLTILNILLYAVFLVLLTGYVLDIRAPYQFENSSSNIECPDFTEAKNTHLASYAQYGIIILVAIELLIEVLEIVQIYSCKVWLYILEIENVLEWITCSTAIIFASNSTGCNDSGISPQLQWTFGTISVFLAWINMLLIFRKFEWFGIYVVMLYRIIVEFTKFFLVFSLLIVAFAISFHCLFQNQENFSTPFISLMKTTSMMIGGPDFTTTFLDETVHYKAISYVVFCLFMVLMTIVVINLLIALAVNNIQEFQNEADAAKRQMQVKFALELERIATSRILLKYFVSICLGIEKTEETLKPSEQWWLSTKIAESWKLTEPHIKAAMNAEKDNSSKIVARLDTKLKTLESNWDTRMKDMETKLGKMLDIMERKPAETSNLEQHEWTQD